MSRSHVEKKVLELVKKVATEVTSAINSSTSLMVWSPVAGGQIQCRPVRWLPSEKNVLENVKKVSTEATSAINFSSSLRDWSPVTVADSSTAMYH